MTSGRLNPKNLKMFTDMNRSDTLIRQLCPRHESYPASIGSGRCLLKFKALIEGGRHVGGVLVGLYSCWEDSIGIC